MRCRTGGGHAEEEEVKEDGDGWRSAGWKLDDKEEEVAGRVTK